MSDILFEKSPYSLHFKKLGSFGAWVVENQGNSLYKNVFMFYRWVVFFLAILGCMSMMIDLYLVTGDFKKMTWNLCITTLFTNSILKNLMTMSNSNRINKMRLKLHRDTLSRNSPEDDELHRSSVKELRIIQVSFYGLAAIFVTAWLVTFYLGYFWSPKDMPIPLRFPVDIDTDDSVQYNVAFFLIGGAGVIGIAFILETELAMFTLLIQITREYKRLLNDIPKLSEQYENGAMPGCGAARQPVPEVNLMLRNTKTKSLLKEYSSRHQRLIEYTEDFEISYSLPLLLQMFALTVLITVSSIQCMLEFGHLSMNVFYQMGYITVLVMDMFLVCSFAATIRLQCLRVGEEAYFTLWYQMDTEIQKDLSMMILRSQSPPKLTIGKVMELNLHAFMITMRNIYSWLALFQQLALK